MQEGYHSSGGRPQRLTRQQKQEMIRNMQKSGIISEKSKQYHKKEEIEAEDILKKLDDK